MTDSLSDDLKSKRLKTFFLEAEEELSLHELSFQQVYLSVTHHWQR